MTDTDVDETGPIDYLVVEFPADHPPDGSALPLLLDLVERNIIRVLDLVFVRKDADGSLAGIAVEDLGFTGTVDVTLFAETSSSLIDRDDLEQAAAVLEPGCAGAILVYENRWAASFATALRREGLPHRAQRGHDRAARGGVRADQKAQDTYIQEVAGTGESPAGRIADAKRC